jgi:hypothetical protein
MSVREKESIPCARLPEAIQPTNNIPAPNTFYAALPVLYRKPQTSNWFLCSYDLELEWLRWIEAPAGFCTCLLRIMLPVSNGSGSLRNGVQYLYWVPFRRRWWDVELTGHAVDEPGVLLATEIYRLRLGLSMAIDTRYIQCLLKKDRFHHDLNQNTPSTITLQLQCTAPTTHGWAAPVSTGGSGPYRSSSLHLQQ